MAYPTTSETLSTSHATGEVVAALTDNDEARIINALTVKAGTGAGGPTAGTVLTGTGTGTSAWQAPTSGFADPLTTNGDIIARVGGVTTRLPVGGVGTFLGNAAGTLGYSTPASGGSPTIQDEGTPRTVRSTINFVGAGVSATDDAGNSRTLVTITGTAGGQADLGWVVYGGTPASTGAASANVTAWASAVSALPAAGGTIFVPAGLYWINGNLPIARSNVRVLGTPGAIFKQMPNASTSTFVIGNYSTGVSAEVQNISIERIEVDGNAVAQDIANTPTTNDSTIGTGTYSRTMTGATNGAGGPTVTLTGAVWGTSRYVGMWVNIGEGGGQSKQIVSHTNTVLTLSAGAWATPPVGGTSVFHIGTQPREAASGWEQTFGQGGITASWAYRVTVRDCYVHDLLGTGIDIERCGDIAVVDNSVDQCGMHWYLSPGNNISIYHNSNDEANYPTSRIVCTGNRLRRGGDVGIDIHGFGSRQVVCSNNTIAERAAVNTGGGWGISCEIEQFDTIDNVGTVISSNNVDGQTMGISITNSYNNTRNFAAMGISGNVLTNCAIGMALEGHHINVSGNVMWNCDSGIDTNNANAVGLLSQERDWNITGNTIMIRPTANAFGNWGIGLRWQAGANGTTLATVTGATGNGVSPIVLTMSGGWTTQSKVGDVIVVNGAVGNTAANAAWEVQAVSGTTVTLRGSTGNGAWSSGGTVTVPGRQLDSIIITGNILQGAGTANTQGTHCGIYIEAGPGGGTTTNASIGHVNVGHNVIHGFNAGIRLVSGSASSRVWDVDIRGARCWNNNTYGLDIGSGSVSGVLVEACDFSVNTLGAITGQTAGAGGNTDLIRNVQGLTPVGNVALPRGSIPSAPTTTTVYTNNTNYDGSMIIAGGTVTVITLQGQTTGLTSGIFDLPVGATIAVTFSVVPTTWKFIAR